jgi:hypothetical protein
MSNRLISDAVTNSIKQSIPSFDLNQAGSNKSANSHHAMTAYIRPSLRGRVENNSGEGHRADYREGAQEEAGTY